MNREEAARRLREFKPLSPNLSEAVKTAIEALQEEHEFMAAPEAAQEKVGTWQKVEDTKSTYACTACGDWTYYPAPKKGAAEVCKYPYCPHCGARMEQQASEAPAEEEQVKE